MDQHEESSTKQLSSEHQYPFLAVAAMSPIFNEETKKTDTSLVQEERVLKQIQNITNTNNSTTKNNSKNDSLELTQNTTPRVSATYRQQSAHTLQYTSPMETTPNGSSSYDYLGGVASQSGTHKKSHSQREAAGPRVAKFDQPEQLNSSSSSYEEFEEEIEEEFEEEFVDPECNRGHFVGRYILGNFTEVDVIEEVESDIERTQSFKLKKNKLSDSTTSRNRSSYRSREDGKEMAEYQPYTENQAGDNQTLKQFSVQSKSHRSSQHKSQASRGSNNSKSKKSSSDNGSHMAVNPYQNQAYAHSKGENMNDTAFSEDPTSGEGTSLFALDHSTSGNLEPNRSASALPLYPGYTPPSFRKHAKETATFPVPLAENKFYRGGNVKHRRSDMGLPRSDSLKLLQEEWSIHTDNKHLRLILCDFLVQIALLDELCVKQTDKQDIILNEQNRKQSKRGLTNVSLLTSPHSILQYERQVKRRLEHDVTLHALSNQQLIEKARVGIEQLNPQFTAITHGQMTMLTILNKERERNQLLEAELMRTQSIENSTLQLSKQEDYIAEVEKQLQKTRQDLLDAKIANSDLNMDNNTLKRQLEAQSQSVDRLDTQNVQLKDELDRYQTQLQALTEVHNSNPMEITDSFRQAHDHSLQRSGQSMETDFLISSSKTKTGGDQGREHKHSVRDRPQDYESYNDMASAKRSRSGHSRSTYGTKAELSRQIEVLTNQIMNSNKFQHQCEKGEKRLLKKLDIKEADNYELKQLVGTKEAQMKDIRANLEEANTLIKQISGKKQTEDQKRLQAQIINYKKYEGALQEEKLQLKKQLKATKMEADNLRQSLQDKVRELSDELERRSAEVNASQREFQQMQSDLTQEYNQMRNNLTTQLSEKDALGKDLQVQLEMKLQKLHELEKVLKETTESAVNMQDDIRHNMEINAEKQENQIRYLKQHLKNVIDEFQRSQEDSINMNKSGTFALSLALKKTLKEDIESCTSEVVALRDILRDKSNDQDALINQKMSDFDEFRLLVLDNLITWDDKSQELADIMGAYYTIFDTQCQYLTKMKKTVWKKDDLCNELQRQLVLRDQAYKDDTLVLKKELFFSYKQIKQDLLPAVEGLEKQAHQRELELRLLDDNLEMTKSNLRREFDQRVFLQKEVEQERHRTIIAERDLLATKEQYTELVTKIANALNNIMSLSNQASDVQIGEAVEKLVAECTELREIEKSQLEEIIKLRDEDAAHARERRDLGTRLNEMEDQLNTLQRSSYEKEEELREVMFEREGALTKELQNAHGQTQAAKAELAEQNHVLAKMEANLDAELRRMEGLNRQMCDLSEEKTILQIAKDRQELEVIGLNSALQKTQDHLEEVRAVMEKTQTEATLDQADHLVVREKLSSMEHKQYEENVQHVDTIRRLEERITKMTRQEQQLREKEADIELLKKKLDSSDKQVQSGLETLQMLNTQGRNHEKDMVHQKAQVQIYAEEVSKYQRENIGLKDELREMERLRNFNGDLQIALIHQEKHMHEQRVEIANLHTKPNHPSTSAQTDLTGTILDNEVTTLQAQYAAEIQQWQENHARTAQDFSRVVAEKIELQHQLTQRDESLNYHKQQHQQVNKLLSMFSANKENNAHGFNTGGVNSLDTTQMNDGTLSAGNFGSGVGSKPDLIGQILAEKEHYIEELEKEITDMRKEIESQRDHLVQYEMQSLGNSSGQIISGQHQVTSPPQMGEVNLQPYNGEKHYYSQSDYNEQGIPHEPGHLYSTGQLDPPRYPHHMPAQSSGGLISFQPVQSHRNKSNEPIVTDHTMDQNTNGTAIFRLQPKQVDLSHNPTAESFPLATQTLNTSYTQGQRWQRHMGHQVPSETYGNYYVQRLPVHQISSLTQKTMPHPDMMSSVQPSVGDFTSQGSLPQTNHGATASLRNNELHVLSQFS